MPPSGISNKFSSLLSEGKKAFIPYIMAGDPDMEETLRRILLLQQWGADIIELGVPFSDPLADGPTIQAAAARALSAGVTLRKIIPFIKQHRETISVPIVLMTYYNPVFKMGDEKFLCEAADAGIAGVIIPDLTIEESVSFVTLARRYSVDTIFLVAPTSTKERIKTIARLSSGFIYCVSITGITGSKLALPEAYYKQLSIIREVSSLPVSVGFGISTEEEAGLIAREADGVIVGSAIVKIFNEDPKGAESYIRGLRGVIRRP